MADDQFHVWEGLFESFREAEAYGKGFADDEWVERVRDRLVELRRAPDLERAAVHEYLLPGLVAAVSQPGQTLTVVDFAGGVGIEYEQVRAALGEQVSLSYHVVDQPEVCEAGRELHAGDDAIRFHSDLDSLPAGADVVHVGSALQYFDDWPVLVARLAQLVPQRFLLSDLYAGTFDSFVTLQNLYGSRVPFRFLNIDEVVEAFAGAGYELVLRTRYYRRVLGKLGPLPMENFEASRRLDYPSHLMFRPGV